MNFEFAKRNLRACAAEVREELRAIKAGYTQQVSQVSRGGSFDETFGRLARADGEAAFRSVTCVLPSLTSGCSESRAASVEAKKELTQMWLDTYSSTSLYDILKDSKARHAEYLSTNSQEAHLTDVVLKKFESSGAAIDNAATRDQFLAAVSKGNQLAGQFEQNINEDVTTVGFTAEELDGLPESFINSLPNKQVDGKTIYSASVKAPVRVPIMMKAKLGETRRRMQHAASSVCQETNGPIFNELLQKRHEAAVLAGYPNHASYVLRMKTAGTLETAHSFCTEMVERMQGKLEEESKQLQEQKKKAGEEGEVQPWDIAFLCNQINEETGIDEEVLKRHFPLRATMRKVFGLYEELLGVTIEEDKALPRWNDEVLAFKVSDAESGSPLGLLYMDLFPREGKYGHQMILPLAPCFEGCLPACCYVGNLSRPEGDSEALMRLSEVRTMYHELGHVMHCICTKATYAILSWAWPMVPWPGGVEQDFLEVPSTMFEQWMYEPEVVTRVCSKVDGKLIPKETLEVLKASKTQLAVVESLVSYYAMSIADLRMHSSQGVDAQKVYADTMKEIRGFGPQEGTHPAASWYHPVSGYDAGYYGYGWAEAYAADLFESFLRDGLFTKATGRKLRALILEPCATKPAAHMLRDFLGREPSKDAYLASLGIA